jgi:hypothetical protein
MHPYYSDPKYKILKLEDPPDPPGCEEEWWAWIEKRMSMGKRHFPTSRALRLAIRKLDAFSEPQRGFTSLEIKRYLLEKAEERGWDGIFPMSEWDFQIMEAMRPKKNTLASQINIEEAP